MRDLDWNLVLLTWVWDINGCSFESALSPLVDYLQKKFYFNNTNIRHHILPHHQFIKFLTEKATCNEDIRLCQWQIIDVFGLTLLFVLSRNIIGVSNYFGLSGKPVGQVIIDFRSGSSGCDRWKKAAHIDNIRKSWLVWIKIPQVGTKFAWEAMV